MVKPKIGVIGVGMVGGAVSRYFESTGYQLLLYDKHKKIGSPAEINKADIIFVCVPTPYLDDGIGFDLSAVEDAFKMVRGRKIVVLKSTVRPGITRWLQKKHPQHKILFNPEFLSEATADEDMRYPDMQILGWTPKSKKTAEIVIKILPRAAFEKIIPADEAEMIKYFHNVHGAVKVVFANQMYDLCQSMNIDYEIVRNCVVASKHIVTGAYLDVWHGRYRGYGGSCFPKDIRALIQFGDQQGIDLALLKTTEKINNGLMKKQKTEDRKKAR